VVIGDTRSRGKRPKKAEWEDSLRSQGKVVNCRRDRKFDVLIDRTTKWGNPFRIGPDGDRDEVCNKYEKWLPTQPDLMAAICELRGKTLGCWCKPERCHGDFLVELANRDSSEPNLKPNYQSPDKSQCCVPEIFKLAMIGSGWIARSTYIWVKTNPKPESVKDRFTDCFEYVYHFVKHKDHYFNTQYEPAVYDPSAGKLRQMRGAFIGPIQPFRGAHFATYPTWLIEPLIEASCPKRICNQCGRIAMPSYDTYMDLRERPNDSTEPCEEAGPSPNNYAGLRRRLIGYDECNCGAGFHPGIVFDPFMGMGTTAVVAEKLGLNWSGIELSKQYIKMAYKRIYEKG